MATAVLSSLFCGLRPSISLHPSRRSARSQISIAPATSSSFTFSNPDHRQSDETATLTAVSCSESKDLLLLLNAMATQGSATLVVRDVLFDTTTSVGGIASHFESSEGYIGVTATSPRNEAGRLIQDFIFEFSTASDAANAAHAHPTILVSNTFYPVAPYGIASGENTEHIFPTTSTTDTTEAKDAMIVDDIDDLVQPRPNCGICTDEILGSYSIPCRKCKEPRCYDCLNQDFRTCLKDINRMPAKCCGTIIHHEVVRGVLPEAEFETYKLKFDEMNAVNPLYCPIPTCSSFIPPRKFGGDNKVLCPTCNTNICTKCKQIATGQHTCSTDSARDSILDAFQYKICPKCKTGVMKMYGCPHVKCKCGAHWCWDCRRPINACYKNPCNESSHGAVPHDDGDNDVVPDDDEDDEAPEPQPQLQPAETVAAVVDASETVAVGPTPENESTEVNNLDDPEAEDWENESVNFGEEPSDENWDVWGCLHRFQAFKKAAIPEFWLVSSSEDVEVECMACFAKTKVLDEESGKGAFECSSCGVIYCKVCKKAAARRVKQERFSMD